MRTLTRCLVASSIALASLALPGLATADGMTLKQLAALQNVTDATISPDGSMIAYTKLVPRIVGKGDDGGSWNELHLIDADGQSRPFITGQVNVSSIDWTPDSRAITFRAKRDGDKHTRLYAIPVAGGEARAIATLETAINDYWFSPDGSQVALLAFEPEDAARKKEKELGFDQYVFEEEWTPRRLYIQTLEGDSEPRMLEFEGSVQSVQWSPAGDRLAIAVTPRELVDDTLMFQRLRIIDTDGKVLTRIENVGKLGDYDWSTDGTHLAFISAATLNDTAAGRLMVASPDSGDFRDVMPDLEAHVMDIEWQTDDTIAFISHEGVHARLGTVRHNGTHPATLANHGGPIWDTLSIGANGRIALVGSTPEHPAELFVMDAGGSTPERLTNSNPWLDEVDLARQEVVTYPARDGLEIEGMLVYPLDYQEGTRYPLILAVHGGPESHYSNGWLTRYSLPAQHAAAEGYFMFFQNYRGSTGRGVEFALTSQGRAAKEEFDDLVDGVDYLIEEGLVDGDKVGITGGSYGGYASAWGATYYSDRFAASVMFVGISELISKLGTTDIPLEEYHVHARAWPWEDWDRALAASPLHYVTQAKTPILILHGDSDPRVDPRQSEILYRYLKLQNNPPPVRLVFYPGEGHGNRRAASRYDYSLRVMRWMNHYLKGPGGDPPPPAIDYDLDSEDEG
ncbi:MAG: S9 family peptidase [Phycisphaerales bacterium]